MAGAVVKRTPIRRQSAGRRRQQAERRRLAGDTVRCCVLRVPNVCTFYAEAWHELVGAGQSGSRTDPRNLAAACNRCNGFVEDQPEVAYRYGWKVRSCDAVRGEGGLVPAVPSPYSLDRQERP
jgi:hypothetical protein